MTNREIRAEQRALRREARRLRMAMRVVAIRRMLLMAQLHRIAFERQLIAALAKWSGVNRP